MIGAKISSGGGGPIASGIVYLVGDWDASTGLLPTTGGTGPGGSILSGNAWIVSVKGVITGLLPFDTLDVGDYLVSKKDNPTLVTDWCALERNEPTMLISDPTVISNIIDPSNWTTDYYTGPLTGLYQNNYYFLSPYEYKFDGTTLFRIYTLPISSVEKVIMSGKTCVGTNGYGVGYQKDLTQYTATTHESEVQGLQISATEVALSGYFDATTVIARSAGYAASTKYRFASDGSPSTTKTSRYLGETDNLGGLLLVNRQEQGKDGGIMLTSVPSVPTGNFYVIEPAVFADNFVALDSIDLGGGTVCTVGYEDSAGLQRGVIQVSASGLALNTYTINQNPGNNCRITKVAYDTMSGFFYILINDTTSSDKTRVGIIPSTFASCTVLAYQFPNGSTCEINGIHFGKDGRLWICGNQTGTPVKGFVASLHPATLAVNSCKEIDSGTTADTYCYDVCTATNTTLATTEIRATGICNDYPFIVGYTDATLATTIATDVLNSSTTTGMYKSIMSISDGSDANGYNIIAAGVLGTKATVTCINSNGTIANTQRLFAFNGLGYTKVNYSVSEALVYITGSVNNTYANQDVLVSTAQFVGGGAGLGTATAQYRAGSSMGSAYGLGICEMSGATWVVTSITQPIGNFKTIQFINIATYPLAGISIDSDSRGFVLTPLDTAHTNITQTGAGDNVISGVLTSATSVTAPNDYATFAGFAMDGGTFDTIATLPTPKDANAFYPMYSTSGIPGPTNDAVDTAGIGYYFVAGTKRYDTSTSLVWICKTDSTGAATRAIAQEFDFVWNAGFYSDFDDFVELYGLNQFVSAFGTADIKVVGSGHAINTNTYSSLLPSCNFIGILGETCQITISSGVTVEPPKSIRNLILDLADVGGGYNISIAVGQTRKTYVYNSVISTSGTYGAVINGTSGIGQSGKWYVYLYDNSNFTCAGSSIEIKSGSKPGKLYVYNYGSIFGSDALLGVTTAQFYYYYNSSASDVGTRTFFTGVYTETKLDFSFNVDFGAAISNLTSTNVRDAIEEVDAKAKTPKTITADYTYNITSVADLQNALIDAKTYYWINGNSGNTDGTAAQNEVIWRVKFKFADGTYVFDTINFENLKSDQTIYFTIEGNTGNKNSVTIQYNNINYENSCYHEQTYVNMLPLKSYAMKVWGATTLVVNNINLDATNLINATELRTFVSAGRGATVSLVNISVTNGDSTSSGPVLGRAYGGSTIQFRGPITGSVGYTCLAMNGGLVASYSNSLATATAGLTAYIKSPLLYNQGGFLNIDGLNCPKVTATEKTNISSSFKYIGYIVYDTTDSLYYEWNGISWVLYADYYMIQGLAGENLTAGDFVYNTGYGIVSALTSSSYDSISKAFTSEIANPNFAAMSFDGLHVYVSGSTNIIYQYDLSPAYTLSSASYSGKSYNFSAIVPGGIYYSFSFDGLKLYIVSDPDNKIYQFSLSVAFDISTATYDTKSLDVSGQTTSPAPVCISDNGYNLYLSNGSSSIYHYLLGTAYDITTAVYQSTKSGSPETAIRGIQMLNGGRQMLISGIGGTKDVSLFNLTTPYLLSSATYSSSFAVGTQDTTPHILGINDTTYGKMYVFGNANNSVYQYTIPSTQGCKLLRTTATSLSKVGCIGEVNESVTAGNYGYVNTLLAKHASSLTPGTKYYLSDSYGAVSSTPGTYSVEIGYAITPTSIKINIVKEVGTAKITIGSGSPIGVITPLYIGERYLDSSGPTIYTATGLTNVDWIS